MTNHPTGMADASGDSPTLRTDDMIFDVETALDRLGGDRELLKELITYYCQDTPQLLEQLQEAATRQDAAEIHRTAHTLKSLAANFDALRAAHAASRVEQLARQGELAAAIESVPAVERQFDRLQQALVERHRLMSTS